MSAPHSTHRPVLVLDGDQPSALAIVRSLGRRGIPVDVGSDTLAPLAGCSRHARSVLRYPDPLRHESAFVDWLVARLQDNPYALIVPVTERAVVPLMRYRHRFNDAHLAMAPNAALEQVLDKDQTLRLALDLGIPAPKSVRVDEMAQWPDAAARLGYPIVVKPVRSVGQDSSRNVQLSVSYASSAKELEARLQQALRYGSVLLQEHFRGDGVGIELIADRGVVRYAFQHRRLHEVPLTGGGSSLRISETIAPALRLASERLMASLNWHGVAMVEFKYSAATGEFRLMEINGRFWGSLPLATAAGADFPAMLHELMTTGRVGDHAPARVGIVCRHLARDIDWLEHVLRRSGPPGLVQFPGARQILRDSTMVFSRRHHFDVQSLRDPWPGVVDLWRIARTRWQRLAGQFWRRRRLAQERRAGRPGGTGQQRLARAHKVLFLCYGNINRSAFAMAYAQSRHSQRLQFMSAGFHAPGGRPADPTMVEVAAKERVDLSSWKSCVLDTTMVAEAEIILAMELAHLDRLLQEHPDARGKAFLLGSAICATKTEPNLEVPDPYGRDRQTYVDVCRQVMRAIDAWIPAPTSTPASAIADPRT